LRGQRSNQLSYVPSFFSSTYAKSKKLLSFAAVYFCSRFHCFHGIELISGINGQHGQHGILPSMLLQATRNPEHLSMSRDLNCTKQNGLAWGHFLLGKANRAPRNETDCKSAYSPPICQLPCQFARGTAGLTHPIAASSRYSSLPCPLSIIRLRNLFETSVCNSVIPNRERKIMCTTCGLFTQVDCHS
jgi:hypothetical protein